MSFDVEELVRRTYADVAERTTIAKRGDADLVPLRHGMPHTTLRGRLQRVLAAAAVVAIVVAGLLVLTGRSDDHRADAGELVHAVPSWIPELGAVGSERALRLTAIDATATVDTLSWAADAGSVTLRAERTTTLAGADSRPTVRRAADGSATGSPLRWTEPTGLDLEVAWTGDLPAEEVERFVRGIVLVTANQWDHLTARGGFKLTDEPVATFRIDADPPFDVAVVGDLHAGLSLRVENLGIPVAVIDTCRTSVNWVTTDEGGSSTAYVVFAPGAVASASVTSDGAQHIIEMTPLGPSVPVSVGGLVLDRSPSAGLPRCRAVAP